MQTEFEMNNLKSQSRSVESGKQIICPPRPPSESRKTSQGLKVGAPSGLSWKRSLLGYHLLVGEMPHLKGELGVPLAVYPWGYKS